MVKKIYEVITTKDTNAFRLKTPPLEFEGKHPTLEQMQEAVGGKYSGGLKTKRNLIEYMPKAYLMYGLDEMIVHEEGLLINLEFNELATQLLNGFHGVVVGDVIVITENGMGKCIEEEEELSQTEEGYEKMYPGKLAEIKQALDEPSPDWMLTEKEMEAFVNGGVNNG